MCCRYAFTGVPDAIVEAYLLEKSKWKARYYIAPTQYAPVILLDPETRKAILRELYWGLVPRWAKDKKAGIHALNARAETVHEKPTFREAFKKRRCLIPATGFYEWYREGKTKTPYYFTPSQTDAPLVFAGLWEEWIHKDETLFSYTILTTEANHLMKPIHDRMPVILQRKDWNRWLDPMIQKRDDLEGLFQPCHDEFLRCWEVDSFVNKVGNDGPECVKMLE